MCGIAGVISRDGQPPGADILTALGGALAHRGPDSAGSRIEAGVALIHRRLSIVDLATGNQPLLSGDGVALIANAEIYNDLDLRRALEGPFKTQSDCESALNLYRRDGVRFASGLRGMYAIAIHDARARRVVLARDPFGIKPLYYCETASCFA